MDIQQLTSKVKETQKAMTAVEPVNVSFSIMEKDLLDKLKELLDEARDSTKFEPFARSELRRFRKHLSKVQLEMVSLYKRTEGVPYNVWFLAGHTVQQLVNLLEKIEGGELNEGDKLEDWGLDEWENSPEDHPELA